MKHDTLPRLVVVEDAAPFTAESAMQLCYWVFVASAFALGTFLASVLLWTFDAQLRQILRAAWAIVQSLYWSSQSLWF